ncbi:MAG TPA: hypothetical protein VKC65_01730 [Gaiellaceae bacterium]|nr:hypothetical protein [Gaiellaceae bacterium]
MEASGWTIQKRRPYPGSTIAVAAIATFFVPLISLIVALLLYRSERDPAKKGALRTWALASGGWIVAQFVIGLVLITAGGGGGLGDVERTGPCVGGPVMGASGRDISGSGTKFVVPCSVSGTVTVRSPIDH